jgi:hypothetical protein
MNIDRACLAEKSNYCGFKSCVDGAEFAMRSEEGRAPQSASRTMKTAKQTHRVFHKLASASHQRRSKANGDQKANPTEKRPLSTDSVQIGWWA